MTDPVAAPRSFPLRVFLLVSVAVAIALVVVPFRRITGDLVAIATNLEAHRGLEESARLAHEAVRAGVPIDRLLTSDFACICKSSACAGICPPGLEHLTTMPSSAACAGDEGSRVCVVRASNDRPSTPLRIANALLALAAITVFAATSLVLALVVARPLRALADEANRVGEGRTALPRLSDVPPAGSRVEEIRALDDAIGAMVLSLRTRELDVAERLALTEAANDELKRTNAALADTRQQLLQAERLAAVGRLSAGLAHEIGNPLTAILALLDLVLAGDLPEEQERDFLERIRSENERIAAIVRGLLDFSRPDLPARDAPEESCEPLSVVDDLIRFFEPQRRYAHMRLALAGDRLTARVSMGEGTLRQVLLNLILNASEALESRDSPGLVLIMLEASGEQVRILVEDDGPGVHRDVGDRLFEPFVTSKATRGGTGLGLSICRGLVEAAGGRLDLERSSQRGTRFALKLRAAPTAPDPAHDRD